MGVAAQSEPPVCACIHFPVMQFVCVQQAVGKLSDQACLYLQADCHGSVSSAPQVRTNTSVFILQRHTCTTSVALVTPLCRHLHKVGSAITNPAKKKNTKPDDLWKKSHLEDPPPQRKVLSHSRVTEKSAL